MGKYLVVEILGPPFWNQLLFQLSVDRVSHWNVPSSGQAHSLREFHPGQRITLMADDGGLA